MPPLSTQYHLPVFYSTLNNGKIENSFKVNFPRQCTLATYIQLSLYMACGSNLMHWNIRQQMKTNSTQQTHIINDRTVRDRGEWGVQGWPRKQSPNTKQQPTGCSLAGAAETSQRTRTSQFLRIQGATQNWLYQREKRVPILRWE